MLAIQQEHDVRNSGLEDGLDQWVSYEADVLRWDAKVAFNTGTTYHNLVLANLKATGTEDVLCDTITISAMSLPVDARDEAVRNRFLATTIRFQGYAEPYHDSQGHLSAYSIRQVRELKIVAGQTAYADDAPAQNGQHKAEAVADEAPVAVAEEIADEGEFTIGHYGRVMIVERGDSIVFIAPEAGGTGLKVAEMHGVASE